MKPFLALLPVLIWANVALGEEFNAKVIAVLDGDTIMVLRDGAKVKIRMANIDAPEKDQAFGMESRQSLLDMVQKKQVFIQSQAIDQYGRMVATVSINGRNINEEQVKHGMAWEYSHFHSDRGYIALQNEAQQTRRGLWAQNSPMAPWEWRKTHPPVKGRTPQAHSKPVPSQTHTKPAANATPRVIYDATCGHKKHCSQMNSCDEAHFYFTRCGVSSLDGDKDGVPCESLCGNKK